jgi:hypothetical protein
MRARARSDRGAARIVEGCSLRATNDVARQLWSLTSRELGRVQDHILLLVKTAQERVVSFLLEMVAGWPQATRSNCRCRVRILLTTLD